MIPALGHQMEYHEKNEPNCIYGGMEAYYYCNNCYQYFLDQEGTQIVEEADLMIPTEPQNHTMRYIEDMKQPVQMREEKVTIFVITVSRCSLMKREPRRLRKIVS